jgi:hypothetical protein
VITFSNCLNCREVFLESPVRKVDFFKALEMIGDGQIQDAKSIAGLFLASAWLKGNT